MLTALLVLPACSARTTVSDGAIRVGGIVHVGPYTQVFATSLPANPAQADVVRGFRQAVVLWEKSENAQRLVPGVRDYVTGQALTRLAAAIKAGKSRHLVPAGVDRFFRTRVTTINGRSAILATCDDGSKFKQQNPRTGKVDARFLSTPGQSYLFETWRMVQLSGHWAISGVSLAMLPRRGAERCQPGMTGSGPSRRPAAAALLRRMSAAVRAARSVHVSGIIQQAGKTIGMNLAVTRSGEVSGRISMNGVALSLLATHGHTYLRLSRSFLRLAHLPADACSRLCGKYLQYPAAQSRKMIGHLSMAKITHGLTSTSPRDVKLLGAVKVAGRLAWLLQDSHESSVYVAARGKPYVIRGVTPPPGDNVIKLTRWNAVRIRPVPPRSQIVHLRQLAGRGSGTGLL